MNGGEKFFVKPSNEKLPYDILVQIFDIYAQWDGIENPLEKLLCICRSWSNVAYEHKSLWTTLRIRVRAVEDARFWLPLVSRRIEHSGDSLLNINITIDKLKLYGPSIRKELDKKVTSICKSIIGPEGCLVKWWKQLRLVTSWEHSKIWNEALSHPTPNLISLNISSPYCDPPILSSAPRLERLVVHSFIFKLCRNPPNLKTLKLVGDTVLMVHASGASAYFTSDSGIFLRLDSGTNPQ
ncbi:hypothetical protein CPB86DRAFT_257270 [Serendipita vermifera]|nr:hypothetical protein CPB86DRAFT_257270 [Serendipita vermifera]